MARKEQAETAIVWDDEIRRYGIADISQLLANPRNWKTHSKSAREALEGSLDELGIIKPLIINLREGPEWPPQDRGIDVMLDGHRRVLVSMERGQPTWPAVYVDLTPAKEAKALLILDELTRLHGADKMLLDNLMREVSTPNAALMQMLAGMAAEHKLYEVLGGETPNDVDEHYQGMPAFEQGDQTAWKSLIVHFACEEDCLAFAAHIDQPMTEKTKFIWYPYKPRNDLKAYSV